MDVRDLPPVSDDEIVGMWRIAADDDARLDDGVLCIDLNVEGQPVSSNRRGTGADRADEVSDG
jgi:hypothetical protein